MAHQAMGDAISMAGNISFTKSFDNIVVMPCTLAPNTFRIPISLRRCAAIKAGGANNPKQAMMMANTAKLVKMVRVRCTSSYIWANSWSRKV